jgi:hypothetical protein
MKKLSPKQFFLLLYLLTGAGALTPFLLMNLDVVRLFYGLPFFLLPFPIIFATFFVVVAIPRVRMALAKLEVPGKYSPKHFLLLLWLSGQALLLDVTLHAGVYALGIACFGSGFWGEGGDEPVFFILATIIVPAGLVAGAFGRLWDWCVTQPVEQMKAKGVQLPTTSGYFAPFGSYGWLWKFSKGIEVITARRIRAAGVFASVFFLGFLGFVIIKAIIQRRLAKVTA